MVLIAWLVALVVILAGKVSEAAEVATVTASTTGMPPPLNATRTRQAKDPAAESTGRSSGEPAKPKLMVVFASRASDESRTETPRTMLLFDDMQVDRKSDVPDEPSAELLPPHEDDLRGDDQQAGRYGVVYNYPKPQQDDPKLSAGYHYPKPQQDDPKPSAGYKYPKPQQDALKPSSGYHYPKPQQDDLKPSTGYDYPKPQQDDSKPSTGYQYPKPQQDDLKPSAGYHYPKPLQDDSKWAGYDYPLPQHDPQRPAQVDNSPPLPSSGYLHPMVQGTSTWRPLTQTPDQDYLPPKGQLPLEEPSRPAYGAPVWSGGIPITNFDEVTPSAMTSYRPEYLEVNPTQPPTMQDELPFSHAQEAWPPAVGYLPPKPQYDSNEPVKKPLLDESQYFSYLPAQEPERAYLPSKQPIRDDLKASNYLPPKQPIRDDAPTSNYLPPKQPIRDDAPINSYIPPTKPLRDDVPSNYLPPKQPIRDDAPSNSYIPPKQPLRDDALQNNYLPPKQPLRDDASINSYIPPKQPLRDEAPTSDYLPPKQPLRDDVPTNGYLPPEQPLRDHAPLDIYDPPRDTGQSFDKEEDLFKSIQAQPRHLSAALRAGSVDEHGIRVTDMSCLRTAHRARFTATITSPRFVAWPPVLEAVPGGGAAPTDCRIIADPADPHHRFLVDLSNPDLTRCGVKGCSGEGEPRLCSRVLMPSLPGLRLASDPVLLLQCSLQPASVSLLQQARIVAAQPASGRSAGVVHAGGERAPLHAHLQLHRRGASGEFSRPMQPGGAVHLGDELQLRATVRRGDGWQSSRLSDVVVRRGSDAVHLVGADGCSNQEMRAVCPRDQGWLVGEPLVSLLTMRVFMFRGMQDGDQLVLTARVVACLDRADCKLSAETCDARTRHTRARRSSGSLNATTISFEESVSFVVRRGSPGHSSDVAERESASPALQKQNLFTTAALILATILPSTALLLYWCKRSIR